LVETKIEILHRLLCCCGRIDLKKNILHQKSSLQLHRELESYRTLFIAF
jgi:hypothetical protein